MIPFKTQVNEKIMEHCRYKQFFFSLSLSSSFIQPEGSLKV